MKAILLSKGKVAIVDDGDFEWLSKWKWCYAIPGYAKRAGDIKMHRVILERLGYKDFHSCDHKNGAGLDNRRKNLRPCTHQQNMLNKRKYKNNTSGFAGVGLDRGKWTARLTCKGKVTYLGSFDTPEKASAAYEVAKAERDASDSLNSRPA